VGQDARLCLDALLLTCHDQPISFFPGVSADIAARDAATTKSVAFSAVSGTEANRLLEELQLTEVDGFAEAPFETPSGQRHLPLHMMALSSLF